MLSGFYSSNGGKFHSLINCIPPPIGEGWSPLSPQIYDCLPWNLKFNSLLFWISILIHTWVSTCIFIFPHTIDGFVDRSEQMFTTFSWLVGVALTLHLCSNFKLERMYLPNPSSRAGCDTRSIFQRSSVCLNSEFWLINLPRLNSWKENIDSCLSQYH